ncbi:MAG: glycosyltransferase [Chloroflexi bacterium]|nr:glycosyltransferase [Chloroflexota bacterium]
MKVSLIVTVKNEAANIASFLDSLLAQTRAPDEVIIVDGGSSDGTVNILHSYQSRLPLQVILRPGANISQGRNVAIDTASGELIASADAGVRLDPAWLEYITQPFLAGKAVEVVSGFFLPDPRSVFETALAATTLPAKEDIGRGERLPPWLRRLLLFTNLREFQPSSRSLAFRKSAWEKIGGYPEWLDYSEDLVFDQALAEAGFRFYFEPQAAVHFRPRSNLNYFARQYFRYARGDGKSRLWSGEHALRYFSYLGLGPALLLLATLNSAWWWIILALGIGVYLLGPYLRLGRMLGQRTVAENITAILWVPIIRLAGDVAKMLGYPAGIWWRIKHQGMIDRYSGLK